LQAYAGRRLFAALAMAGLLAPAVAAAATPTQVVQGALARAREISADDLDKEAKLDQLRGVARELFDTRAMGRRAIGPVLDEQGTAAQQEFLELFDEFIVRAYLQKLLFFRDPRFRIGPERKDGAYTVVNTWIDTPKDSFEVDYAMEPQPDGWRANDVRVEGVSLGSNYGEQFRSLLRDHDFEYLLSKMRRKVDHFRGRDDS